MVDLLNRAASSDSLLKEFTMGFFSKVLEKLGINSAEAATPQAAPAPAAAPVTTTAATPTTPVAAAPAPIAVVDVVAQLEQRAAANPQKLNWRTSIVDLLKLLDIDSSLVARKALATELRCPDELMGDSAQMNMWLHKNVLAHIAANGGNIPAELLD
jgi:hypothetical protein